MSGVWPSETLCHVHGPRRKGDLPLSALCPRAWLHRSRKSAKDGAMRWHRFADVLGLIGLGIVVAVVVSLLSLVMAVVVQWVWG